MPRPNSLTGYDLARRYQACVVIGAAPAYLWRKRLVVLPRAVALGVDAHALVVAAHETAHFLQHREIPWIFWLRWLDVAGVPFRNWQENDAWRRAVAILELLHRSD